MIQKLKINFITLLFILISSCSDYRKILKTEGYEKKLKAAIEFYENDEFFKASTLFNDIKPLVKGSEESETVDFYFASSLYNLKQFDKSAKYFKGFIELFSRSEKVVEAEYLYAISLYKTSPNSNLDQSSTVEAISAVQNFINKYPYSEYSIEANKIIDELQIKLETKNFENAKQYFVTEHYKSAIIALENMLIDFPSYSNREEVHFLIVKSSYLLAKNSISTKVIDRLKATLDAYKQFKDNYPDSEYLKELQSTYNKTQITLTELKQNKDEI